MNELPEEPEDVAGRVPAWAIIATIFAVIGCAVIVWLMRPPASGAELKPVFAAEFDEPTPFEQARQAQATAMNTWTWADPQHTRVRLPVSMAIDRYIGSGGQR